MIPAPARVLADGEGKPRASGDDPGAGLALAGDD